MNNDTFKENIKLIGAILVTAIFNFDPFCLVDEMAKRKDRKDEHYFGEEKHKTN